VIAKKCSAGGPDLGKTLLQPAALAALDPIAGHRHVCRWMRVQLRLMPLLPLAVAVSRMAVGAVVSVVVALETFEYALKIGRGIRCAYAYSCSGTRLAARIAKRSFRSGVPTGQSCCIPRPGSAPPDTGHADVVGRCRPTQDYAAAAIALPAAPDAPTVACSFLARPPP
jgi:hypothetical protein